MTQPPGHQPGWWQPPSGPVPRWQQPDAPAPQWQQPPAQPSPQPPPPWPQQQWQQPDQPQPAQPTSVYGGFGAFDPDAGKKWKRSPKSWLAGVAAVVVLAGGGVTAWALGAFSGDVLDPQSVQNGVLTVLRQDFGESDVRNAQCPSGEPIKTGTTFECSVVVAGQPKKVTIRVLNEQPQFEVGAPR